MTQSPKKVSSLFNNGVFGNSSPNSLTQLAATPSGQPMSSPIASPSLVDQSSLPKTPSLAMTPISGSDAMSSPPTSPLPMPPPSLIEMTRTQSPKQIIVMSPQVKPQQAKSILPSPPALGDFSPIKEVSISRKFDTMSLPETPSISAPTPPISVPTPFEYSTPVAVPDQLPLEIATVVQPQTLTFIANNELLNTTGISTPLINIDDNDDTNNNSVGAVTDELSKKGFTITHKLYDGNKIITLLASSKNGDNLLIEIDSDTYQPVINKIFSANDVSLMKSRNNSQIPHDYKSKMLKTLQNYICGTAYICNNNICIIKQLESGIRQNEWEFENPTDIEESEGEISVPYLTMPLSLITGTEVSESEIDQYITNKTLELTKLTFENINSKVTNLFQMLDKLTGTVHAIPKVISFLREGLDTSIATLEKDLNSAPNPAIKGEILKMLSEKKLLRLRLANKLLVIDKFTRMLNSVSDEIHEMMDPILSEIGTKQ